MKLSLEQIPELNETTTVALFRSIQEVLNNAIKYAYSTEFTLSLQHQHDRLIVTATDNGKGFDITKISESKGIGWNNVYSRIELIGGHVKIYSRHNEGTTVKLEVPVGVAYGLAQPA